MAISGLPNYFESIGYFVLAGGLGLDPIETKCNLNANAAIIWVPIIQHESF